MKKVFQLVLLMVVGITLTNCTGNDGAPGQVIFADVYETTVNFRASNNDPQYADVVKQHPYDLSVGDTMLVFYEVARDNSGFPVWAPLPAVRDMYQANTNNITGALEYNFEHAPFDFVLMAKSLSGQPLSAFEGSDWSFVSNVKFRIVYILGNDPATIRTIQSNAINDKMSYDELVTRYNLKESAVKAL